MDKLRDSVLWSLAAKYASLILQVASFLFLARLLTPEDIGLYSIAAALIGMIQVLREFGVGSYLVQEPELNEAKVRTAFTISVCLSVVCGLGIFALAGTAADFYRDARLEAVIQVLGLSFLLIPLSSTALAFLTREMRFRTMFWISTGSQIANNAAALTLAAMGFAYWSLVLASLVTTVVTTTALAVVARGQFVHRPDLSEWRGVLQYCSQSVVGRVIAEFGVSFNDLVVGRVLGIAQVGIMSRALGVMNLCHRDFIGAVRSVAFPAFAQIHREGGNIEELHAKFIANVAAFAWPFYGFFALFPLESLRLLFGRQWDAAAPLVPVVCAAGALAVLWSFVGSLLTATGQIALTLRIELVIQPLRIGLLSLVALSMPSLDLFAWALLAVYAIQLGVAFGFKQRKYPTDRVLLWQKLRPSLNLSLCTLFPAAALKLALASGLLPGNFHYFVLAVIGTAAGWFWGLNHFRHPLLDDPIFLSVEQRLKAIFKT